jgi:DNA-binding NarL/FixJ family response regulator
LRRVENKFPWIGLVVLTSHMSPELAVEDGGGLPAGAVYLVKSQLRGVEALEDAVERSIAGLPVPPVALDAETHIITAAQAEVLRMLATGASTKALAEHRGTTVRAVETMLARLYSALGLADDEQSNPRVAAVRMWERGQVSVRPAAD